MNPEQSVARPTNVRSNLPSLPAIPGERCAFFAQLDDAYDCDIKRIRLQLAGPTVYRALHQAANGDQTETRQ